MTVVYIVRHCESLSNLNHSLAGQTDIDISEKGALQLECLSNYFKNIKLHRVYSSHLSRAYKTAEAINKYNSCDIIIDDSFIELNLGVLEGKSLHDMTPQQTYIWHNEPHNFRVEGGETMDELAQRAWNGLKEVAKANPDSTIAVASHGGTIRNLLRVIKGYKSNQLTEVGWCDNTGVNKIVFYDDGRVVIEKENDISHLSSEALSEPVSKWTEGENE